MKPFLPLPAGRATALTIAFVSLAGCEDPRGIRPGDIRSYTVAKAPQSPTPPAPRNDSRPNDSRQAAVRYEVPAGWQDLGGGGMRLTTLAIGPVDAGQEVSLSRARGTLRDNVIRWQRQLVGEADAGAVEAAADRAIAAAATVDVGGVPATVVLLDAEAFPEAAGAAGQAILAAVVPGADDSLFVKFRGSAEVAARERENFLRFVGSLRPH